jgi:hypothetical protein
MPGGEDPRAIGRGVFGDYATRALLLIADLDVRVLLARSCSASDHASDGPSGPGRFLATPFFFER